MANHENMGNRITRKTSMPFFSRSSVLPAHEPWNVEYEEHHYLFAWSAGHSVEGLHTQKHTRLLGCCGIWCVFVQLEWSRFRDDLAQQTPYHG